MIQARARFRGRTDPDIVTELMSEIEAGALAGMASPLFKDKDPD